MDLTVARSPAVTIREDVVRGAVRLSVDLMIADRQNGVGCAAEMRTLGSHVLAELERRPDDVWSPFVLSCYGWKTLPLLLDRRDGLGCNITSPTFPISSAFLLHGCRHGMIRIRLTCNTMVVLRLPTLRWFARHRQWLAWLLGRDGRLRRAWSGTREHTRSRLSCKFEAKAFYICIMSEASKGDVLSLA